MSRWRQTGFPGGTRGLGGGVVVGLILAVLLSGCTAPEPYKRTFVGAGERKSQEQPEGLNPLGGLETCVPAETPQGAVERVLVSRPEFFTAEASQMIAALHEGLSAPERKQPPVEFQLSAKPITNSKDAEQQGRDCIALIVLWEPGQTKTLRLTLPHPAQIPLRSLAREKLCEFGDHREQLNILYATIAGLLALRENDYNRAVFYLESAARMDDHCLTLPGTPRRS